MGHLKIYCHNCTGRWEVYERDLKSDSSRICPYCFKEIDKSTWAKEIIPGYERMKVVDNAVIKDYLQGKAAFFGVSYSSDNVLIKKAQT